MDKKYILSKEQIERKIRRMAVEILERASSTENLIIIGIDGSGAIVAQKLQEEIVAKGIKIQSGKVTINKANPLEKSALSVDTLNNKTVVLVDDVANSGKTLLYAMKPILAYLPEQILFCVLVDRTHKRFPIKPDIIGHTVSTTIQERIIVDVHDNDINGAYLV